MKISPNLTRFSLALNIILIIVASIYYFRAQELKSMAEAQRILADKALSEAKAETEQLRKQAQEEALIASLMAQQAREEADKARKQALEDR